MNKTLKLVVMIDMLLDGRLTLVTFDETGLQTQYYKWSCPNLRQRNKHEGYYNQQYFPEARDTALAFEFELPLGVTVDVEKSTIELGFTGNRDNWVGPGRLFRYSLSRYIPNNIHVK